MADLSRLSEETSSCVFSVVEALQPATARQIQEELVRRHGLEAPLEQLVRYLEWLRSGFPRKLAHAGPDRWIVVDLG